MAKIEKSLKKEAKHSETDAAPEHREDASHLSDGPDLVSDYLLPDSGSSAWETKQKHDEEKRWGRQPVTRFLFAFDNV